MGADSTLGQIFGGFTGGAPSADPGQILPTPAAPSPQSAADIAPPLEPGQTEMKVSADPNGWTTSTATPGFFDAMTDKQRADMGKGFGAGMKTFGQLEQQRHATLSQVGDRVPIVQAPQYGNMGAFQPYRIK